MTYHLTDQQLLERFQNTDFVLKTQAQIAKDFERLGYETPDNLKNTALSFEDLIDAVADMLIDVVKLGESQTLQLL